MNKRLHIILWTLIGLFLVTSCAEEMTKEYTYECGLSEVESIPEENLPALEQALLEMGVPLGEASSQVVEGKGFYEETIMADADQKALAKFFVWSEKIVSDSLPYESGQSFNYTMYRLNRINAEEVRRVAVITEKYTNRKNHKADFQYICELSDTVALTQDSIAVVVRILEERGTLMGQPSLQVYTASAKNEIEAIRLADAQALKNYNYWLSKVNKDTLPVSGGSISYTLFRQELPIDAAAPRVKVQSTAFAKNYKGQYRFSCELTDVDSLSVETQKALRDSLAAKGVMLDTASLQTINADAPTEKEAEVQANSQAAVQYEQWCSMIKVAELPIAEGEKFSYTLFRIKLPEGENPEKVQIQTKKFKKEKDGNKNSK